MDQDRARSLLIAERDEVRGLLKESDAAGQADRVAEVESEAEDNADAAPALTRKARTMPSRRACATGWTRSGARWPGWTTAPMAGRSAAASQSGRAPGSRPGR